MKLISNRGYYVTADIAETKSAYSNSSVRPLLLRKVKDFQHKVNFGD